MPTKKPGRTPWPIPEDVEQYLRNELFENRFLSLRDRVSDIQAKFGFYLSYNRLRNFFRRNGIKYARTKIVMKASLKSVKSRAKERKKWAQEFVSLIGNGSKIWIIDETSTSLWSKPKSSRTW